ncbi:MAG: [acyl-carrier-protein] S-malonyltransferase [Elusimicrobia bacterium RIFCSPLOWO2_01_FULL_64_13]|nr:MAG: [acyl-carrier-protein] S-malonyltransferase [Elusimicrobia bacterium RIFCSPLOWO2_01_FULL_64_13]
MVAPARNIALLFPGQGSQHPGMGRSLAESSPAAGNILARAEAVLGGDFVRVLFEGPEEALKQTAVAQPAIYTVSAMAFAALVERSPDIMGRCACAAGHSLGEYSALHAGNVFDFNTGLKLVEYRGQFIRDCCDEIPGTMAAVVGVEKEALAGLCRESANGRGACEMVNFNSPGQIVVAGTREAVAALVEKASALPGARCVPLNVSGAFHSSLMAGAARKMAGVLQGASLRDAEFPVLTNADARPETGAEAFRKKLVSQIDHPVLWEDSVVNMTGMGAEIFIELGPGKVLAGLMRRIDRSKKCWAVGDGESLEAAAAALE